MLHLLFDGKCWLKSKNSSYSNNILQPFFHLEDYKVTKYYMFENQLSLRWHDISNQDQFDCIRRESNLLVSCSNSVWHFAKKVFSCYFKSIFSSTSKTYKRFCKDLAISFLALSNTWYECKWRNSKSLENLIVPIPFL